MTIKQQGGIFGRNPTFQDLSVEGSVTVPNNSISGDAIDGGHATPENITVGDTVNATWLGVSIADPVSKLHLNDPSGTYINMKFSHTGSGTTATDGFDIVYTGNDAYFTNRESGPFHWYIGGGEKLRLETNGDVNLLGGNLIVSNGKGIDFSATAGTGTSELFDDYEEGTWTPVFADDSTGGNVAAGGSFSAFYTKVGRQVTVTVFGLNINTTGMTGANNLYIRGFPFISNATASDYGAVRAQNVAYQSGASIVVQLGSNSTVATIIENVTNAATGAVSVSDVSSGVGDILFSMTYTAS